jgi:hypothetical protein
VRFGLNQPGQILLAAFALSVTASRAADATSPIDYTQRNSPYSPAGSVEPEKKTPALHPTIPEKRVEKPMVEKPTAAISDRRARIEVTETREKQVREKKSHRPEVIEQPTSAYNQQLSHITTSGDTKRPPTVAKYQDSLTAASASNMARFPAVDRATTAKINRFLFRRNPPEIPPVVGTNPVTPVAGGSPILK